MISSTHNARVKSLITLHQSKGRRESGSYLIEGIRLVESAVQAAAPMGEAYFVQDAMVDERGTELLKELSGKGVELISVTQGVIEAICQTKTPQGIVARVTISQVTPDYIWAKDARLVMVDRVQDPGNLGTIIRTAAANAVTGVILTSGTVDLYNDKVLRSTMGALWQVPIQTDVDPVSFATHCRGMGLRIAAAVLDGQYHPCDVNLADGVVVVVGNEATGITEALCSMADHKIKIPMLGVTESLNVAVALGVLLYEGTRQKLQRSSY